MNIVNQISTHAAPTETIYPEVSHPYYIVAPPYIRTSAGVRVEHLLCHSLNKRGYTAYIMLHPRVPRHSGPVAPDLLTPIVTDTVIRSHFERGLTPIVVYPEVIPGNPFDAPCVVRYVMNFPGLLGGDQEYAAEELVYSYSQTLANATRSPGNVLFLPPTDTSIFRMPPAGQVRQGTCFYADKYKVAHNGKLFDITKDSLEITRDQPNSQSPHEIAAIFQRSELFYVYENTALATEAVLCGCPAVFLPNAHLTELIAVKELGPEGFAWGADPSEVARAKATVEQGAQNYLKTFSIYWRDLEVFIERTQAHAKNKPYVKPIRLPRLRDALFFVLKRRGVFGSLRKLWRLMMTPT